MQFLASLAEAALRVLLLPFVWMAAGAQWAARRAAERTARVKDDQLEVALDRPSRGDLVERLRKHEF